MTDFIHMRPLRAEVAAALRGHASWPPLTAEDAEALDEHGLAPLVFSLSHDPALRDLALRAAAVEPLRLADLHRLLGALENAIVIKGGALAYTHYPAPELRPRGDTDLLVDDFPRARATLEGLGYAPQLAIDDEHGMRQQTFTRVDEFGFEHAHDVHWAISNSAVFAEVLRFDEVAARAVPFAHGRTLAPVDALLLACIHRVAHHHDSDRLIWLYDIHLLRERMTADEHARFWALARERRVLAVCARAVELAEEWFGASAHDKPRDIPADEPSSAFLSRDRTRAAVFASDLRALGWRARLTRIRQLVLPPRAYIEQTFPGRPSAMLPLLYAWRAVRGVARLFRRV